jgi:hypothetical protein
MEWGSRRPCYKRYYGRRAATLTWFEARAQMSCWGQRSMEWVSPCVARCGEGTDCCHGPGTTRIRLIPIRRSAWHLNIPVSEIPINMLLIAFEGAFSVLWHCRYLYRDLLGNVTYHEFKVYLNELWVTRAMIWRLAHETEVHSKDEVAVRYLGDMPGACLEQLKRTTIKFSQNWRYSGRYLNSDPLEMKYNWSSTTHRN